MHKLKTWSDPMAAIALTCCRATIGPDGARGEAAVTAPYTIVSCHRGGWEIIGKVNGIDWYVTRAATDDCAKRGFRTWRDALAACRRLYPGAVVCVRQSDRREILMDNAGDYAWRVGAGRGDDLYARPMVSGRK